VAALPTDEAATGTIAVHVRMMHRSHCFLVDTHYCCLHRLMLLSLSVDSFGVMTEPDSAGSSRRDWCHHSHLRGCCRMLLHYYCSHSYYPIRPCSNKMHLGYRYCRNLFFQRRLLLDSDIM
jgi:hypothetical protein